jgi:hypothetical protein
VSSKYDDEPRVTQFFVLHPWRGGAISGLLLFVWCVLGTSVPILVGLLCSVIFALLISIAWRNEGPAYKLRQAYKRKYEAKQ